MSNIATAMSVWELNVCTVWLKNWAPSGVTAPPSIGGTTTRRATECRKLRFIACHSLHYRPHLDCPGLNVGLRGENPASNRLSYCTLPHQYGDWLLAAVLGFDSWQGKIIVSWNIRSNPRVHSSSYTMGTGDFPRGKADGT
jgi:hypothetical protein